MAMLIHPHCGAQQRAVAQCRTAQCATNTALHHHASALCCRPALLQCTASQYTTAVHSITVHYCSAQHHSTLLQCTASQYTSTLQQGAPLASACPQAVLKKALPQLAPLMHDSAPKVREAMAELLLTISSCRDLHFYDVVPLETLLQVCVWGSTCRAQACWAGPSSVEAARCTALLRHVPLRWFTGQQAVSTWALPSGLLRAPLQAAY